MGHALQRARCLHNSPSWLLIRDMTGSALLMCNRVLRLHPALCRVRAGGQPADVAQAGELCWLISLLGLPLRSLLFRSLLTPWHT